MITLPALYSLAQRNLIVFSLLSVGQDEATENLIDEAKIDSVLERYADELGGLDQLGEIRCVEVTENIIGIIAPPRIP